MDGFTGSTTSSNAFDNIDDIVGSAGADTLTGTAAGGTFTVLAGSDTYASGGRTLTFNSVENLTGGSGNDAFIINDPYTGKLNDAAGSNTITVNSPLTGSIITGSGNDVLTLAANVTGGINAGDGNNVLNLNAPVSSNITTGPGADTFNFNGGALSGNLSAGLGDNIYNFNGGSATGTVNITGNDTWNHAAGISLGSAIVGSGNLTAPDAGGGDLVIGPTDLTLPNMTGFTGHFIVGGTITTPDLPLDGTKTVVVNSDTVTLNSNVVLGNGGSFTMLGSNLDLNAGITAGGIGVAGSQINLFAVGDTNGGSGPGNITGLATPVSIKGGSMTMIAQNDIVNAQNFEIELGGGILEIATGSGNIPTFGFLDATQNLFGSPGTIDFLLRLGLTDVTFVQGQILVLANLIGLEQIAFIDVGLFETDLSLFGVIGQGVALALAQCEEIEGCAPNVTDTELKELIAQLEGRVSGLQQRIDNGSGSDTEKLQKLMNGYENELDTFKKYKVELEEYNASDEETGNEDLGDEFTGKVSAEQFSKEDAIAAEIRRLSSILDVARKRIEWLQKLKTDPDSLGKLAKSAGLKLTVDAVDEIINATKQEMLNIQKQIQTLLDGKQAQADSPFYAEAGTYGHGRSTGYGEPLYTMDENMLTQNERWY